jgi:hypothetical protein
MKGPIVDTMPWPGEAVLFGDVHASKSALRWRTALVIHELEAEIDALADKSLFARQVERYADVYTSRVSNLLYATPNGFLRAFRSPLPHDQVDVGSG